MTNSSCHKQVIYSRYEYSIGDTPSTDVFREYREAFHNTYDERGVQIGGVGVAVATSKQTAILLVYSKEADTFLRLKFFNRKDVKYNKYY